MTSNNGWRCPGCGRCYAPYWVTCTACGPADAEPVWSEAWRMVLASANGDVDEAAKGTDGRLMHSARQVLLAIGTGEYRCAKLDGGDDGR